MQTMGLTVGANEDVYLAGHFASTVTFGPPGAPTLTEEIAGRGDSLFLVQADREGVAAWARAAQTSYGDGTLVEASGDRVAWTQGRGEAPITFDGGSRSPLTFEAHGLSDFSVATYSRSGDLLWAADTSGNGLNDPLDLAWGPDGSVYVVGTYTSNPITFGPGAEDVTLPYDARNDLGISYTDGFVAKWNPDGSLGWAASFTGDGSQIPDSVAVTADGTVVVVGSFALEMEVTPSVGAPVVVPLSEFRVGFALGFSPSGELRWSQRWGNTTSGVDEAEDAVATGAGAYVVGYMQAHSSFGPVWPTPQPLTQSSPFRATWHADGSVDGVVAIPDFSVWDIDADADGRMALAGMVPYPMTFGTGADQVHVDPTGGGWGDPAVATFAPDGSEECLWPILSDREDFYDRAAGIALDGAGGVWATGYFTNHLTFVPGTPEEVTLTAEGGAATTWLAHFQIARP